MPQYMITYLGGNQSSSPEEGKQHFAKYMEWIKSLGDAAMRRCGGESGESAKGYANGESRQNVDCRWNDRDVGFYSC